MTYLVGIDASKYKHDYLIADEKGECLYGPYSFENNEHGFKIFLSVLEDLKPNKIKIGFESTGHYTMNLKIFLEDKDYDYMEINPLLIKNYIKSCSLRKTKTDKKDSSWIAKYLSVVDYKPYPKKFYHLFCLKSLTRLRHSFIEDRSKQLNKLTRTLDLIFPEIKPYFDEKFTSSLIYILDNYLTPEHIKRMTIDSYNKMKCELKHTISYQRFCEVKELAKNTVGVSNPLLDIEIRTLIDLYKSLNDQISNLEKTIEELMMHCPFKTVGVKGIGIQSAAVIISEIGDFKRFEKPSQLLSFIGLDPAEYQSGTEDHKGHMVKHGSSYLRYTIMNVAETFYVHNPVISDYYWKKRNEGKSHRVALSHVARRLIYIIHFLETNNIDFDQTKLR